MLRGGQYPKLTIPNEVSYADVAAAYVEQAGKKLGFVPAALQDIAAAVCGVVSNTIKDAGGNESYFFSASHTPVWVPRLRPARRLRSGIDFLQGPHGNPVF
jgi:hypothetical protein